MTAADTSAPSRFVVGLDLGTTNSAMAYVDTNETPRRIHTFVTPQIVAPGQIEARETLPSFHYQPAPGEFPPDSMRLPWQTSTEYLVGHFARDHGTVVPGRLIGSAKSWLCHNGVDRTADLLPWQGAEDVTRLSPVTASARYLEHFRAAWDHRFPDHPLAEQDFVLTLPASFDEVARELTIKAAKQAGLQKIVLIEEPQAAFYAWIDKHTDRWEQLVSPGQTILVCDVGGGTTDFTLIRVRKGKDETIQFHRVAVGDHLILGGDNIDLALAHHLESRVQPGGQLDPRRWGVLVRSCRALKEVLLGEDPPEKWTLTLPGSGSKLIGGSIQIPVTRQETESVVAEGFFPEISLDAKPLASKSGFQEFGLPYAADAAITKYLAAFLTAHGSVATDDAVPPNASPSFPVAAVRPDIVLFNGGVFASPLLRDRLIHALETWFRSEDSTWTPTILENERLDLAVARGAAYYGMVRRGEGVRIAAGLARTYYIGVETAAPTTDESGAAPTSNVSALCLVPAGIEPGQEVDLSQHQFQLRVSEPIEFPLFVSSTRLTDRAGDLIAVDPEQIKELPPIRTVLKTGKSKDATTVAVILKARLTEIGTLDLWCSEVGGKRSWQLLFDVRSATRTELSAHQSAAEGQGLFENEIVQAARGVIVETFAPERHSPIPGTVDSKSKQTTHISKPLPSESQEKTASVVKRLEQALSIDRGDWPTSLLRQLWDELIECESGRWASAQHESRWLNLTGFSLRPGYGLALDDWRCSETWKRLQGKLAFATTACRAEWYILWRRIAGGLTAGQQLALAAPLISQLKQAVRQLGAKGKGIDFGGNTHESSELLRLLGSCELLPISVKHELGDLLLEILGRPRFTALSTATLWAIGRVGARQPVYGPLNSVVPAESVARWLTKLAEFKLKDNMVPFTTMQLARKTGDRYRDLDDVARREALRMMDRFAGSDHYRDLVTEVKTLETADQSLIFGEALPKGLRIL
ncbi:Hsp70 family protein [Schlesneria paludicola]|uniref:Hsp70 family protein n=1 Tax=Schlesneria paludicola TaxID=360056 RepID=UPI000492863E|nr:Hsp70 family protein [Schlesneria paludicola]